ncbi:hypothetical protein SEA_DATBOI_71 [Gordonia phage DatBoi]|nr:hypothetical protein SEA_DATBOI_71 [Gordonia phage DatBoi]
MSVFGFESKPLDAAATGDALELRSFVRHVLEARDNDISSGGPWRYTKLPSWITPETAAEFLHRAAPGVRWVIVPDSPKAGADNWVGPAEDWTPEAWDRFGALST